MSWEIISASIIGSAHVQDDRPCQDSFAYRLIGNDSGIAIVADGAGSCENSDIGSSFVVNKGVELFERLVKQNKWIDALPPLEVWREEGISTARRLSKLLEGYAEENKLEFKSLSSTFIIIFFSNKGVCSLNIGDGRGAVKNVSGEWSSVVNPYHGEQVGMTVFLTSSPIWMQPETFIRTSVLNEELEAFIILSDGYEKITFECCRKGEGGCYFDPNKPFSEFLDFKLNKTKEFLKTDSRERVNSKWCQFLRDGNEILKNETDDKTMILGLYL